ncbi:MAG: hypothetical protein MZW92_68210 [Comamonadaceae bacterium]|nr:hypothetical protein [Comamonadaceae bacterium]
MLRLRQPEAAGKTTSDSPFGAEAAVSPLLARLLVARERRPQPARDEKMVVALNGLAIEALARRQLDPAGAALA